MRIWADPACDELLRRSVTAGHTFARICGIFAEELGIHIGRNAVIGRAYRLGLTIPKPPPKPKKEKLVRYKPKPTMVEPPPPVEAFSLSFMRLRSWHCRYPNEDASRYCGQPKANGSSYCPAHHRICYMKSHWQG